MEKQNKMITDSNMNSWYALRTLPGQEYKLMQSLNAAEYAVFCPVQVVFVNWRGKTQQVFRPLFSGCVFVAGNIVELTSFVASRKASFLLEADGKHLCIQADKAEVSAHFSALFK